MNPEDEYLDRISDIICKREVLVDRLSADRRGFLVVDFSGVRIAFFVFVKMCTEFKLPRLWSSGGLLQPKHSNESLDSIKGRKRSE
jgi:hypothetical protein